MMDRKQEYWALISALNDTPPALEDTVQRARDRHRRQTRARRWLGIPVATLGGLASAFVLLVNFSLPFALACRDIPFLREMAAAVAFSPTLKAAVENDYYQYVGQTQTVDGVTLTVHYLVLDPSQINVFYTIDSGPLSSYQVDPTYYPSDGTTGYATSSNIYETGGPIGWLQLSFPETPVLPETFTLALSVFPGSIHASNAPAIAPESSDPWSTGGGRGPALLAHFSFPISISPRFTTMVEHRPVDRWIDLDGRCILVHSANFYPLTAQLNLEAAPENTDWLTSLDFYLEDENGTRYEQGNGSLLASGSPDSPDTLTYYMESGTLLQSQSLTLHITGAQWLRKADPFVTLDLETGTAQGLPPWARVVRAERTGDSVQIAIGYTKADVSPLISMTYHDPQGEEHRMNGMSTTTKSDDATDYITLEDYPWDTVRLELTFTDFGPLQTPISIPLK